MNDQSTRFPVPERHGPFGRFAFARAFLVVGVVLCFHLEPRSLAQGNQKELKSFRLDFRGQKVNEELLMYLPETAGEQMKVEAEGLRISAHCKDGKQLAAGVATRFPVTGDCEITTSYEFLSVGRPAKGYGEGVSLFILTPSKEAVVLANFYRIDGHFYSANRNTTDRTTGQRQSTSSRVPTEARSGKFRLVRRGTVVTCLVAEAEKDEFRELKKYDLGNEDLSFVRVAADTGDPHAPVEVRIHDFEIRPLTVPLAIPAETPETPRPGEESAWLPWAELLGLGFVLTAAAASGVWLYLRQNRRADAAGKPATPAPAASFACSQCGKRLKVRVELAGKKVKCSGCGNAILVPDDKKDEAGRFSE